MPNRGGHRGGPLPRSVQVSKKLSWLLRHGAEREHLTLGPGGYVPVDEVLANRNIRSLQVTFEELRQLVRDNDKQRFSLVEAARGEAAAAVQSALPSDDPRHYLIRANQGHSLKVESEGLLRAVTEEDVPDVAVHGTTHAAWPLIVRSGGLRPMTRNHVHFASGLPAGFQSIADEGDGTAAGRAPVISGMRNSSTIVMFLDVRKAMDSGIRFGVSDNGVILSEGNTQGIIPLEVFKRVEDRTGEGVLLEEGKIIKEAPASWASKAGKK